MTKVFTKLANGDCLEKMKSISDGSVDMILCDPPYGITVCPWDTVIDLPKMWIELNRVIKSNGAIVLFGNQPFTTTLIASNIKQYRYNWTWFKDASTGHMNSKKMPMKCLEDIMIFYNSLPTYNPQGLIKLSKPFFRKERSKPERTGYVSTAQVNRRGDITREYSNYPNNLLRFKKVPVPVHPTQKPVKLLEYLIRTYTNESEVVLDFTMGSGSTGVACVNTNRSFIGIELDANFFKISQDRIAKAKLQPKAKKLF